jgi:hypothetical protein
MDMICNTGEMIISSDILKCSKERLFHCHFVHHNSYTILYLTVQRMVAPLHELVISQSDVL